MHPSDDPALVSAGPWSGWRTWSGYPFENASGPYYLREEGNDGFVRCAFRVEEKHLGIDDHLARSGCILAFADFALTALAWGVVHHRRTQTISLNAAVIGSAKVGDLVEATGQVVSHDNSLLNLRGQMFVGEATILSFSGVMNAQKLGA